MSKGQIEADRRFLVERFPRCFVPKGIPKRPLAVGIHVEMIRRGVLPTDRRVRAFLGDYTRGPAYHEALAQGGHRYGLDGQPAGEVDEGARHRAVTLLGQLRAARLDRAELKMMRESIDRIFAIAIPAQVTEPSVRAIAKIADSARTWRVLNNPAGAAGNGAPSPEEENEDATTTTGCRSDALRNLQVLG